MNRTQSSALEERKPREVDAERGSVVAEFALVTALLCLVFLLILQVGFALHVRNTAISHAIEGARVAARADAGPGDGEARTRELLARDLAAARSQVSASTVDTPAGQVVEMYVRIPVPLIGVWGVGSMTVRGRAYEEDAG